MRRVVFLLLALAFASLLPVLVGLAVVSLRVDPQTLQLSFPHETGVWHVIADNGSIVVTTQDDMYLGNGVELIDESTPFSPRIIRQARWTVPWLFHYRFWGFPAGDSISLLKFSLLLPIVVCCAGTGTFLYLRRRSSPASRPSGEHA